MNQDVQDKQSAKRKTGLRKLALCGFFVSAAAFFASGAVLYTVLSNLFFPQEYRSVIKKHSAAYGLDPLLVSSLIYIESHFDPSAVSPKKAVGLMQVLPTTARFIARKKGLSAKDIEDLKNPENNIRAGCAYLSYLMERYSGREEQALAAYNAGTTNVDRWMQEGGDGLSFQKTLEAHGFDETKNYVENVLKVQGYLAKLDLIKKL